MKRLIYSLLLMLLAVIPAGAQCPDVIFDNDMGNDVDDILALDMLLKYHDAGQIRLIGVLSNRCAPSSSQFTYLYNAWSGHPEIPLGLVHDGVNPTPEEKSYSLKTLQMEQDGRRIFNFPMKREPEDATLLYRRLLSRAKDGSVVIVSTGFSTNLARLLQSPADKISSLDGRELLKKKVRFISVMAGNFQKAKPEYNVHIDKASAKTFFEGTPVPLIFSDFELGYSIRYPGLSLRIDFNWTDHHPLVEAWRYYFNQRLLDRPSWDATSVLYAVHPESDFFTLGEPGNVTVDDQGVTTFHPAADGLCRVLSVTDAQRQKILTALVQLIPQQPMKR